MYSLDLHDPNFPCIHPPLSTLDLKKHLDYCYTENALVIAQPNEAYRKLKCISLTDVWPHEYYSIEKVKRHRYYLTYVHVSMFFSCKTLSYNVVYKIFGVLAVVHMCDMIVVLIILLALALNFLFYQYV